MDDENRSRPRRDCSRAGWTIGPTAEAEHYRDEGKTLAERAHGKEAEYDRLNYHDEQFDLCDAALSVACAAVAALTNNGLLRICA